MSSCSAGGMALVATLTNFKHDRIVLSPGGMHASLPETHSVPLCHTAERKLSSICVVTGVPLGWRGFGGRLVGRIAGSNSVLTTLLPAGVPMMAITPTVGPPALQVKGGVQSALL